MAFDIKNRRYTGCKTKLIDNIKKLVLKECKNCQSFFDVFAGTGVVSASLLPYFHDIYINDFLFSNEVIYKAFFENSNFDFTKIIKIAEEYKDLKADGIAENFVSKNYGDKYFNMDDALKIGYIREKIESLKESLRDREYYILLASLLYSLDRSANTVGHYEAYIKSDKPILPSFKFELINPIIKVEDLTKQINIYREDANTLVKKINADVVYIDPPYSSRQYSRFYHVLETIVKRDKPELFGIAMKPKPENMSKYCSAKAIDSFNELISNLNAKYIIVSYNNTYNSRSKSSENKMRLEDILMALRSRGETKKIEIKHSAFNAGKTDLKNHKEILFITEVNK